MLKRSIRPDTRSFNAALLSCVKSGDAQAAKSWLRRMRTFEPSIPPDDFTYTLAIRSCANAASQSDAALAEEFFGEMHRAGALPNTITLDALAEALGTKRSAELCRVHDVKRGAVAQRTQRMQASVQRRHSRLSA